MKKLSVFLLVLLMCLQMLSSCTDQPTPIDDTADTTPSETTLPTVDEPVNISVDWMAPPPEFEVPSGSTAQGVIMFCAQQNVPANFLNIYVTLKREDGSTEGFYYNWRSFGIDKLQPDGTWKSLPYYVTAIGLPEGDWKYAENGVATLDIERDNLLVEQLTPGRYRAVAFVGSEPTAVCGYFNIK